MKKERLYSVLRGKLLLSDDAAKNWLVLLYLGFLAMVMIANAHTADSKIHKIALENIKVKEYRTQFIYGRSQLMRLQMESEVEGRLSKKGIKTSKARPFKIIVK